jgi:hypothetical protein
MRASQCPNFTVRFVKLNKRRNVNVRDPIAISRAENSFRLQIFPRAPEPRAGHRIFARVHARDAPRLGGLAVKGDTVGAVAAEVNGDVIRHCGKVKKKIADVITLVAEQQNKFVKAISAINFHDVPQNRAIANQCHRLGKNIADFTEAHAAASA